MSKTIKGLGIGEGIVVSKAFVLNKVEFEIVEKAKDSPENEYYFFQSVEEKAVKQMDELIELAAKNISEDKADIFRAHKEILKDEEMRSEIKRNIDSGSSVAFAISVVYDKYSKLFEEMPDNYFKERASDIKDLKKRLLTIALNIEKSDLSTIEEECIVIANDLTPSETSLLNKKLIKGFVTEIGGVTSHSAIMAKTMGFLAIVSASEATSEIKTGDLIALDTQTGFVYYGLEEDGKLLKELRQREKHFLETIVVLESYKKKKCCTLDGRDIQILGNIGQPSDMKRVREYGGEGVGLFRTEFLYMKSKVWPNEELQYNAYKQTLSELHEGETVTIRTLDIGGDKSLDYYEFPKESNPFLGYRAIRISLKERVPFITQLRAILKSSTDGQVKIMFPMITTYEEFVESKNLVESVQAQLEKEGHAFFKKPQVGLMIEVPAAALIAKQLAKVADFFSIGSNDLIQYTNAVDRMSEHVSSLYQPNSPGVLNLINMVAKAAIEANIDVSVCGEMASNPHSALLLVGMGITKLSMSAPSIPAIKRVLNNITYSEAQELLEKALSANTEKEILQLTTECLEQKNILF